MIKTLLLYMPSPSTAPSEWMVIDQNTQETVTLSEAVQARVTVLIPGSDVLLTETHIPSTQYHTLAQAIPFALEEQISSSISASHFAFKPQDKNQAVAVIERQRLQDYIDALASEHIVPHAIMPLTLALPCHENTWSIIVDDHLATLRMGLYHGMACDRSALLDILHLALQDHEQPTPQKITLFDFASTPFALPTEPTRLTALPVDITRPNTHLRTFLAQHMPEKPPINLLQGRFQLRTQTSRTQRYWRIAIILFFIGSMTWLSSHVFQALYFNRQQNQATRAIASIYQRIFPQARTIVSPKIRMQRTIDELREHHGGDTLLRLLAKIAPVITKENVTLSRLAFANQQVQLAITLKSFADLQTLRAALQAKQLHVTQRNVVQQKAQVVAELLIQT